MKRLNHYTEENITWKGNKTEAMKLFENSLANLGTVKEVSIETGIILGKMRYGLQMTSVEFVFSEKDDQIEILCRGESGDLGNKGAMRSIKKIIEKVNNSGNSGNLTINPVSEAELSKRKKRKFAYIFFGILAFGFLLKIKDEGFENILKVETVKASPWDGSVEVVEKYLKKSYLNDPSSYESIKWGKVYKNTDGTYQVIHSFRARNGFGGMVQQSLTFTISEDGERVVNTY